MAARLRSCALLAAGTLGLHQLRYSLGYGGEAGHALRAQGHSYLGPVTASVVGVLILALALGLHRLARGEAAPRRGGGFLRLWSGASAALLAIFAAQESVEGAVATGHPGGLAALVAHGGWLAAPLAAVIGFLIALALRGASTAGEAALAVARRLSPTLAVRAPRVLAPPRAPALYRVPVLAAAAAGRAPPRAS
jgi:hypothetical protein